MSTPHTPTENSPVIETYAPGWFDRLQDIVERLPIPYWITYLFFGAVIFGTGVLVKALDPLMRDQPLDAVVFLAIFQISYVLWLIHFLDRLSARAFDMMRPILKLSDAESQTWKQRLTTMPPAKLTRLAILVLIFFIGMGVFVFAQESPIDNPALTTATTMFSKSPVGVYSYIGFSLLWIINAIFIYHTVHQLRTIAGILRQHATINLFHQTELYAFSRVAAATGIGLVLTSPVWMLLDRGVVTLVINVVFSIMAVIIFVTPLIGTHLLLRRQKEQLLRQSMTSKEALINDLFARLERGNLKDVKLIEGALSGLDKAHSDIKKISTWPWQMETVRQIIGAISLPITIWFIQFALSQVLSS